ncbi:MAG: sigma-70 family RNA polymerase sigma factor [Acidobacteriota bacterium]
MSSSQSDLEILQSGYRYALSLTGDPSEAEDLAQQGWLRLFKRYGGARGVSAMLTTVRRLFIDRYRRGRRVPLVALEDLQEEPRDLAMPTVGRVDMERLLARLRSAEREALYLHAVEGRTAAEIAELTGQSRNTVLSLIHRGRKKLARGAASVAERKGTA